MLVHGQSPVFLAFLGTLPFFGAAGFLLAAGFFFFGLGFLFEAGRFFTFLADVGGSGTVGGAFFLYVVAVAGSYRPWATQSAIRCERRGALELLVRIRPTRLG